MLAPVALPSPFAGVAEVVVNGLLAEKFYRLFVTAPYAYLQRPLPHSSSLRTQLRCVVSPWVVHQKTVPIVAHQREHSACLGFDAEELGTAGQRSTRDCLLPQKRRDTGLFDPKSRHIWLFVSDLQGLHGRTG
jgi:hypothetical protein